MDDLPQPLPGGARCWLTEPDPAGAESTVIDHGDQAHALLLGGTDPAVITAVNHYPDSPKPPTPPTPPTPLPDTGTDPAPWALAAFGLLLLGTVIRLRARLTDR